MCARSAWKEEVAGTGVGRGTRDSFWMVTRRPRWEGLVMMSLKAVRSSVDAVRGGGLFSFQGIVRDGGCVERTCDAGLHIERQRLEMEWELN